MPRDIRNTKLQDELFQALGNMENPTAEMFASLFARHKDSPEKYRTDDLIEIGPEQSPFVKPHSVTTVGLYMVNKFILEDLQVLGYVNCPLNSNRWGDVESAIASALLNGDIKQEQVVRFIDRSQYLFGGPLAHLINPSISSGITTLPPSAVVLKKKLLAEHKKDIDENNPLVAADIEKEITTEAMKTIRSKNDPSVAFFDSGAIDPYNNYKTMVIMKGAVQDNTGESPSGYKIVTSNYNDGITKEDIPKIADSLITSAYSRGVSTQDSGYNGKKMNIVLQGIRIQEHGSDCGTKMTMTTVITKRYLYRYIVENGKNVLLTDENIGKYLGKPCKLRTPIHCHAPDQQYCNICVGERPYRIGVHNVGLTLSIVSGATLNASMKKFHDSRIKHHVVTDEDILKYVTD